MSNGSINTITMSIPDDKDIRVVARSKAFALSYQRVGNGAMNRGSGLQSIDIMKEMEHMTLGEVKALNIVRTNISWERDLETNEQYTLGIAHLPASYFESTTVRSVFQKGVRMLRDKDLVIKVGRNDYMLNPKAIIPTRLMTALHMYYKNRLAQIDEPYDRESILEKVRLKKEQKAASNKANRSNTITKES